MPKQYDVYDDRGNKIGHAEAQPSLGDQIIGGLIIFWFLVVIIKGIFALLALIFIFVKDHPKISAAIFAVLLLAGAGYYGNNKYQENQKAAHIQHVAQVQATASEDNQRWRENVIAQNDKAIIPSGLLVGDWASSEVYERISYIKFEGGYINIYLDYNFMYGKASNSCIKWNGKQSQAVNTFFESVHGDYYTINRGYVQFDKSILEPNAGYAFQLACHGSYPEITLFATDSNGILPSFFTSITGANIPAEKIQVDLLGYKIQSGETQWEFRSLDDLKQLQINNRLQDGNVWIYDVSIPIKDYTDRYDARAILQYDNSGVLLEIPESSISLLPETGGDITAEDMKNDLLGKDIDNNQEGIGWRFGYLSEFLDFTINKGWQDAGIWNYDVTMKLKDDRGIFDAHAILQYDNSRSFIGMSESSISYAGTKGDNKSIEEMKSDLLGKSIRNDAQNITWNFDRLEEFVDFTINKKYQDAGTWKYDVSIVLQDSNGLYDAHVILEYDNAGIFKVMPASSIIIRNN